jgi:hypothetical protein
MNQRVINEIKEAIALHMTAASGAFPDLTTIEGTQNLKQLAMYRYHNDPRFNRDVQTCAYSVIEIVNNLHQ